MTARSPKTFHPNRRTLAVLTALVALFATGCWPQSGAGPNRRSYNPFERTLTMTNVASLERTWETAVVEPSEPVVAGTSAYVATDHQLFSFDTAGGELRWSKTYNEEAPPDWRALSAPILRAEDGSVSVVSSLYVGAGQTSDTYVTLGAVGGQDRGTTAVSGGRVSQRGGRVATSGSLSLTGSGGDFVDTLTVVDLDAGTTWGRFADSGGVPTLGEESLFLSGTDGVSAYDVTTPCPPWGDTDVPYCEPMWTATLDASGHPVVIGEHPSTIFVGSRGGTLYALDAATGATRWTAAVGAPISAAPALARGMLYVPTDAGTVAALPASGCGAATCPVIWRAVATPAISAQPAVGGGVLYAGSSDGTVDAFPAAGCGATSCAPVWSDAQPSGATVAGLALHDGSLYVSRTDGLARYAP